MKPQLDDTARRNLVTYRLSRSHSALDEVKYLAKGEFLQFCREPALLCLLLCRRGTPGCQ